MIKVIQRGAVASTDDHDIKESNENTDFLDKSRTIQNRLDVMSKKEGNDFPTSALISSDEVRSFFAANNGKDSALNVGYTISMFDGSSVGAMTVGASDR